MVLGARYEILNNNKESVMKYRKLMFGVAMVSFAFSGVAISQEKTALSADLAKLKSFFTNPRPQPNHVDLLFLQQADSGSIVPDNDKSNCYTLTLTNLRQNVLFFSDQPKRMAGQVSLKAYMEMWAHDPIKPNVAMQAFAVSRDDIKEINVAAVLSNPSYNPQTQTMIYRVCPMKNTKFTFTAQMSLRSINLFIDPIHPWPP